jgi:hypothetical protein
LNLSKAIDILEDSATGARAYDGQLPCDKILTDKSKSEAEDFVLEVSDPL